MSQARNIWGALPLLLAVALFAPQIRAAGEAESAPEAASVRPSTDPSPDSLTPSLPPSRLIFNEIKLEDGEVLAVDTLSQRWRYQFSRGEFVLLPARRESDRTGEGGPIDERPRPAEMRCTEERLVRGYETSSVLIGYDEYVDGDITAFGRVTVKGWVKGNVTSINDRVLVTESGRVDGNVTAPDIVTKPGAEIRGETIIKSAYDLPVDTIAASFSGHGLIIVAAFTAFFLICAFLVHSLAPRQMEAIDTTARRHKAKTTALGFLMLLLLAPIVGLVIVTIVGILIVVFIPLAYVLAMILGLMVFGRWIGHGLMSRLGTGRRGRLLDTCIGLLLVMTLWFIVAALLGSSGATAQGFGIFLLVVAIVLTSGPILSGIGAATLTRFGFRPLSEPVTPDGRQESPAPTPAPPPIPDVPTPPDLPGPPLRGPRPPGPGFSPGRPPFERPDDE